MREGAEDRARHLGRIGLQRSRQALDRIGARAGQVGLRDLNDMSLDLSWQPNEVADRSADDGKMLGDLRGVIELVCAPGLEALQAVEECGLGGSRQRIAGQQNPRLHRFEQQRRAK